MTTLSRGIRCQFGNATGLLRYRCDNFAHEEFVTTYDQPVGTGYLLCHFHAMKHRNEHGIGKRTFKCRECGEEG